MFLKIKHAQDADSDLLNAWQTFAQIYINVRPKEGKLGEGILLPDHDPKQFGDIYRIVSHLINANFHIQ